MLAHRVTCIQTQTHVCHECNNRLNDTSFKSNFACPLTRFHTDSGEKREQNS